MKGKFRILRRIGLGVFLVCALMVAFMPVAPVSAATAVTEVGVDFPGNSATAENETSESLGNIYIIHFKPTTALSRGVDTVTVTWPDGSAAMCGTASTARDFTVTSAAKDDVEFSTDWGTRTTGLLGYSETTWHTLSSNGTVGGYRVQVTCPIDIAAGQDVWIRFVCDDTDTIITSCETEAITYKVKVQTSKDTTPVLSSAFPLGATAVQSLTVTPLVTTAGVTTQYIAAWEDTDSGAVGDKVTLKFPLGTTMPSTISTTDVLFSNDATNYSNATAATIDADLRTITATTPIVLDDAGSRMKILSGAGVTNPQTAATIAQGYISCMISTSTDARWFREGTLRIHGAGSATKVLVANGEIGEPNSVYSDDATMINMASSYIYVTMADQYGNAEDVTGDVTVTPSSSSGTGTFYTCDAATPANGTGTYTALTTITCDEADPTDVGQQVYYKDTTAGTHTLTFSADTYTSATWTITVAPAISVYDANNNLVNTYGATSTSPVTELGSQEAGSTFANAPKFGRDYIVDAIAASLAGDTIKLGDGIYEMDDYITLNKKATLTSVNGAAFTTIRPVTEGAWYSTNCLAVEIGISGTAAYPVIIDGITFDRLRLDTEFDIAVFNNGYNYVTVRNCTFNYILPEQGEDHEWGSVIQFIIHPSLINTSACTITSATISNNTFNNCCPFAPVGGGDEAAVINLMTKSTTPSANYISGVTVSGNTFNNCNGFGIALNGYDGVGAEGATESYITAEITDNTLNNCVEGIILKRQTHSVKILRNTINGAYTCGLFVGSYANADHDSLVIKNNTFTGCAGANKVYFSGTSCAIKLEADGSVGDYVTDTVNTVQYNDIYDNDATYSIYSTDTDAQDCQYNWFGDATGPYYSALTGATIAKSNPNGTGKKLTDYVTYYPWLYKSKADVVADNVSYQTSTMKLIVGWNTLSTPVKLIAAADTIDELIPSGMTIGYYYDAGWQLITTGYVLSPCDAVYVKMSEVKYPLLKFDAGAFSTPSKDLAAGWNLISMAALDSTGKKDKQVVASVYRTAANLPGYSLVINPSINTSQYGMYYNAGGASWSYSADETTGDGTNYMWAGLGYWCYMQNAATLAGFEITPIAPDLD